MTSELLAAYPFLAGYRSILMDAVATVPIPHVTAFLPLLKALRRIGATASWLRTEGQISYYNAVDELETIQQQVESKGGRPYFTRPDHLRALVNKYPVYASLFDAGQPPDGLEQLRGLAVLCAYRWHAPSSTRRSRGHEHALITLASAIRGAKARTRGDLAQWLPVLAPATTMQEFVSLVGGFAGAQHEGLVACWERHYLPELIQPGGDGVSVSSDDDLPSDNDEDTERTRKPGRLIAPELVDAKGPAPVRGEAVEEVQGFTPATEIVRPGRDLADGRTEHFLARQSIWSQNHLLLTQHPESLLVSEAQIVAKYLVTTLESVQTTLPERRELTWLLLSLLTGRAMSSLGALRLVKSFAAASFDPAHWDIGLAEGSMRLAGPAMTNAFQPTPREQRFVEVVDECLCLPLPPRVVGLLRARHLDWLRVGRASMLREHMLEHGARRVAAATGLAVSAGRIRRTLACVVHDLGRNLPATMTICGDVLGRSAAPLYYYSAPKAELAALYTRVMACLFDGGEAHHSNGSTGRDSGRVGSRLLVTRRHLRQAVQSSGTATHAGLAKQTDVASLVRLHNALVDHVACMLICVAGHRPTNALFDLKRGDLDLTGQLAVFSDKRVDPAHWTRLVVLAPVLVRQLEVYFEHLGALREQAPQSFGKTLDDVLQGTRPFLFHVDGSWAMHTLDIPRFREGLPPVWHRLPLNFSRTHIYTRGIEAGARPELLAIQLGHLDAVGLPWGDDGPTEPVLFAEELSPVLEQLAKDSGWKVMRGCRSRKPPSSPYGPRLRRWQVDIDRHEAATKRVVGEARAARHAIRREYRAIAEKRVLEALEQKAPVLSRALGNHRCLHTGDLETLLPDDVETIQDELKKDAGDLAETVAAFNALSRLLKQARKAWQWKGHVPGGWLVPHRDAVSPFFPRMMLAKVQVDALRRFYRQARHGGKRGATGSVIAEDFAWAALGLLLFGFVEREDELLGILAARKSVTRSSSLRDLVLVAWSKDPRRVTGLRGLAALAVAALAKRYPSEGMPAREDIETALQAFLPARLGHGESQVLTKLCETVHVCNRLELSGAARLALDPVRGSVCAAVQQQVSWIDRDVVEPSRHAEPWQKAQSGQKAAPHRHGAARRQYKRLLKVFPLPYKDTVLPRTGTVVSAVDVARGRKQIIRELEAWERDPETNDVVAALAWWAIHMLRHGTTAQANPALSTVHEYLSAAASRLIDLTEGCRLSELDEAELTCVYLGCVQSKPTFAQARTAREILNFHNVVAERYQLATIDDSEIASYVLTQHRSVDAELITPMQRDWAMAMLAENGRWEAPRGDHGLSELRANRQAAVLLAIQGHAGNRYGESSGMRLRDTLLRDDCLVLRFTANRHRRVKTRPSNRSVDMTHRFDVTAHTQLAQWVTDERERWGSRVARHAYLCATSESAKDLTTMPAIKRLVSQALSAATGRSTERNHRLRHCCGTEALLDVFLSSADRAALDWIRPLAIWDQASGVRLPRDLHRQSRVLGQATPTTTIRSYFHLPWAARSRSDSWINARWLDRHTAATALGVTVSSADRTVQRAKQAHTDTAWLDHVLAPRTPIVPQVDDHPADLQKTPWQRPLSAKEVAAMLGWTTQSRSLDGVARSIGASRQDADVVRQAAKEYAQKTGCDFLRERRSAAQSNSPRRVRRLRHGDHLWQLLETAEQSDDHSEKRNLMAVVDAHFAWAQAMNGAAVRLPNHEAQLLVGLLESVGQPERFITATQYGSGTLVDLQIHDPQGGRYGLGRLLKRLLGFIWVAQRLRALGVEISNR